MRLTQAVTWLAAVSLTSACSGSPTNTRSESSGTSSGTSSGSANGSGMTSPPVSGSSAGGASGSIAPSSGATPVSGESSLPPGSGASSGADSTVTSGSVASGSTSGSSSPSGASTPPGNIDTAGMTNASDVDAARIVEPTSLDCPNGCNTDASYPAMMPTGTPMPLGDQTLPRKLYIENQCTYTTWTISQGTPSPLPGGTPLKLDPGQAVVLGWSDKFSGRIWPRSGCSANGSNCTQGNGPDTLAEFTLTAGMASDWYDVSLVDGFSIPVGIIQLDAPWGLDPSYIPGGPLPKDVQQCGSPICAIDMNPGCPAGQQLKDKTGNVWGCKNGQSSNGGHGSTPVTSYLKAGCPTSYVYAFDDPQSLFLCKSSAQNGGVGAKDYKIIYCPTQGPTPGFP